MFQLNQQSLGPSRQPSPARSFETALKQDFANTEASLVAIVQVRAAHQATRPIFCIRHGDAAGELLTYQMLDQRARAVAAQLQEAGAQGERVLLLYPFGADFITAFLGSLYAGAIAVPLYPPRQNRLDDRLLAVAADAQAGFTLTTEKIRHSLDGRHTPTAAPAAMQWLATPEFAAMTVDRVQSLATAWQPFQPAPDALAFLQYTSGSTGLPKGVMVSHDNLLHNVGLIQAAFGATPASRGVMWVPFYHDMGLIGGLLEPLVVGIETHLMSPIDFLQRPIRWLEAIAETRATISGGPNFAYELCVDKITEEQCRGLDLSSWSVAFSGAEPVRAATLQRFAAKFAAYGFRYEAFTPCYGLAESTLFVSSTAQACAPIVTTVDATALTQDRAITPAQPTDASTHTLVSSGHNWLDHTFHIVHPQTHTRLADNEIGEIWISGPSVAKGYWNRAAATAATFHARLAGSGEGPFLRSGDLGFLRAGELFVTGRLKDLIIIRGKNYYPQDIEQTVELAHPALRRGCGAAFSIEHGAAEQLVIVQEIERTHLKKLPVTEVITAMRRAVIQAHQLQPHAIVLLRPGRIAKTTSGKIQRHAIKAAYLDRTLHYECRWSAAPANASGAAVTSAPVASTQLPVAAAAWPAKQIAHKLPEDWGANAHTAAQARSGATTADLVLQQLYSIMAQLLHIEMDDVSPQTSFFALGADSLVLIEAIRRLKEQFGVETPPLRLFDDLGTPAALAAYIAVQASGDSLLDCGFDSEQTIEDKSTKDQPHPVTESALLRKRTDPKTVPLTAAQQQLWFLSQFNEDASLAYNESVTLHLQGELAYVVMRNALQTLVERHEALRTIIGQAGDVQLILPALSIDLPLIDFSGEQNMSHDRAVAEWLAAESRRPIDLNNGPLVRLALLKLASNMEYLLVLTAHHIMIDGLSLALLLDELATLYCAGSQGHAPTLTPALQFSAYVDWQITQVQTAVWATQKAYWLRQLQGPLPVLELPLDHARPPLQTYNGAIATAIFDADLTTALKRFSGQQDCTLFMTLFAAYVLFLHRLSGQEEVIVGIPAAGRSMLGAEQLVGYCTHLLPIRHTLTGNPDFVALLRDLRAQLLVAYEHQDYPFAHLINQLNVERDLSLAPIVNTTFTLTRQLIPPQFTGLTATIGPRPTSFVDHDLGLNIIESGGTLTLDFEYNRDLFDAATVARFANHFATLVGAIVTNPLCSVTTLPLLTPRESQQLLVAWNATDCPFNEQQTFHQLFEAQVAKTPDAVALLFADQRVTYAELNAVADAMAQQLQAAGVTAETVVALLCDRSPAFLAAVIAIFKAGAAYLPLDTRAPAARQTQILAQSRTRFLLITAAFAAAAEEALLLLPDGQRPQVINIGENYELQWTDHDVRENPLGTQHASPTMHHSPLAYLIYTSGSTGLPKGAMVEQRGMINHLYAKIKDLDLTAADTVAQTAPQSFDISVWQFLCPLVVGGRVHIFPDQVASDPVALLTATVTHNITVLEVVPSLLRMMIDELERGLDLALSQLRWMIPTGEALPPNLARQWLRRCPAIPLVNAYGPTECSDDVTHCVVSAPPAADVVNMPIGRPIINTHMYILDEERQPVPIGVAGELYVGGIGVGRGYIYDDARTAQAFVPDPFSTNPQARLYKTGDKARYLPDGNIEYLGRLDYQVKIRGFRIELGEIEAVLEAHPAIRQAIVMDQPDPTGNKRLVAYVVPNLPSSVVSFQFSVSNLHSSLRRFLGEKLPDYMVPAAFVLLDAMPLTPNGKVDRKALPQPDFADSGAATPHVPPRTDTETALVTIWSEVLKVPPERIGIHHDFFMLGGHSLLATQAASRIRRAFQVELPLQTYFTEPTIAALAEHIETTQWAMAAETTTTLIPLAINEEEGEL